MELKVEDNIDKQGLVDIAHFMKRVRMNRRKVLLKDCIPQNVLFWDEEELFYDMDATTVLGHISA